MSATRPKHLRELDGGRGVRGSKRLRKPGYFLFVWPVLYLPSKFVNLHAEKEKHTVRLLTFVPGEILFSVPYTKELFYQIGEMTARIDLALSVSFALIERYRPQRE